MNVKFSKTKKKTAAHRLPPWVMPWVVGMSVGAAVCFLLLLLMAALMTLRDIPQGALPWMVNIAGGLGALAAGFVAAKKRKQQGMMVGAACGGTLFLLLLLAGMIAGSGFTSASLVKLAVFLLMSAIGGVLGVNQEKKRKIKIK